MLKQFAVACVMLVGSLQVFADTRLSYDMFLESVQSSPKTAAALFTYIDHDLPSYWSGTGWDYNGVSRTPGQGSIACGYFVTTLLQDLGFSVERVRLAQAASSIMIGELTTNQRTFNSLDDMLQFIEKGPVFGIYIAVSYTHLTLPTTPYV